MMKQGMFGVLTYSALDIQRSWRGYASRKRVKNIRYQVAVITIQYWIRDILHNRTLQALQKLSMRKFLAREMIGYWLLRTAVLPKRHHHRRQEQEHREHKRREHEKKKEQESRKREETEKAVAEAREKKRKEMEERQRREAAEAGDEGAPAGAGALPGQDKSEACTIM